MDIIKLRYAVIDDSSRIFNILVFKDIKIDDIVKIINDEHDKKYITLFYEQRELNSEDNIIEYWESNPQYIFIASTNKKPPTSQFREKLETATENEEEKSVKEEAIIEMTKNTHFALQAVTTICFFEELKLN